ncbi:MAG: PAS domain S-box protein [Cyanobacteriota bacterium]|nr:PAS domain S-box protein [Cyanobacteriota bacterium]
MSVGTGNSGVILIVDDEISNLQALMSCLEGANFRVLVAKKGARGLQIARSARPDLILLDIRMPNLNGYELCSQLKAGSATRDIPVIFMTAHDNKIDRVKCFEVGGMDYIAKPFQVEEVLARVRHQITICSLRTQLELKNTELEQRVQERTAELERANAQLQKEFNERVLVEAEVREVKERYDLAVSGSGDGIWDWNQTTGEVYFSPRFKEILGYDENEQLWSSLEAFTEQLHPLDRAAFQGILRDRARSPYKKECRIRKKGGEYGWILLCGQALWDETGTPARAAGSISDIAPLKEAEDALRQANEELERRVLERTAALEASNEHLLEEIRDRVTAETALREAQERYELAVRGSGAGIWDWNIAGNEAYIAPRYKQILGYDEDELPDFSRQDFLTWLHPEDRDRVISALRDHFEQQSPYQVEYRIRKKGGEYCWMASRGQALWDKTGKPTRMAGSIIDITPLKEAEEALRRVNEDLEQRVEQRTAELQESQQRLQAILDNTASVVSLKDLQGRYLMVNLQFFKNYALSPEEVLGQRDLDLFPTDIAEEVAANDRQVLKAKASFEFEERAQFANGTMRTYISIKAPLCNESGTPYAICCISSDITEHKQAEILLRDSQERLRLFVEHAPAAIAMFDYRMHYLAVSRRWITDYHLSQQNPVGLCHYDVFPTLSDRVKAGYESALNGEIVKVEEELFSRADGQTEWMRYEIHPWYNHAGNIGGLMMCSELITERKQAQLQLEKLTQTLEERVREQTAQVRASEAKFRAILNNIPHKAWLKDRESRFVAVNLPFCEASGKRPGELIGQTDDAICPTDLAQTFQEGDRAVMDSRRQRRVETCSMTPEGELQWAETYKTPIFGDRGEVIGTAGIAMDITDRKRTETELQQLNEQLRRSNAELERARENAEGANRAKSDFLAKMTHELRTPLNAILGFTQILTRAENLQTEQRQQLDIVIDSGEHLLALINDILDMSKIEAGKTELNLSNFDFYHLLHSIEQMLQLKAQMKGLVLSFEISSQVPQYICADEQKLRQVLINLLGNAIKFTSNGSVTLRVLLGSGQWAVDSGQWAVGSGQWAVGSGGERIANDQGQMTHDQGQIIDFKVEDTGCGIAPSELEGIFEAFTQSEAGRYALEGGTGLGLAISKRFVELMDGNIIIESTAGEGTTVCFQIKVASARPEQVKQTRFLKRAVALAPNQPRYRILVVEDRWENRQLLVELLSPLGFEVLEATNGHQGIEMWERYDPHLILMDLRMPVMNGYEAIQNIKATLKGQATPIVALTASALEIDRKMLSEAGCDHYLCKPFQIQELLETMAHHLGARYLYETDPIATAQCKTPPEPPSQEELAIMPNEWLSHLYWAAIACDREEIAHLLCSIPDTCSTLRCQLEHLVENFHFPAIANLVEPFTADE